MNGMRKIGICLLALSLALALGACGAKREAEKQVDLKAVMASIEAECALPESMFDLAGEDLLDLYGIETADVKQFAAKMNSESIACDELVLIEATDADAAKRVREKLDNRYQAKLNENRNYLPAQYAIIEKCAVSTRGNYVAMLVAENASQMTTIYDAAFQP